jgi:hypothetical protein
MRGRPSVSRLGTQRQSRDLQATHMKARAKTAQFFKTARQNQRLLAASLGDAGFWKRQT